MANDENEKKGQELRGQRSSFKLTEQQERQLIESGGFIRELDEKIQFEKINEKVDTLIGVLADQRARIDKFEDKFETRIANVTEKVTINDREFEHSIAEMRVDIARLETQVKVLLDLKENNWLNNFLKLVENKQVRAGLLLIGGWIASRLGPDILKALLRVFQ